MQAAKASPSLLPLGVLVQALSQSADEPDALPPCRVLAASAASLERMLVAAISLTSPLPQATVSGLTTAIEAAVTLTVTGGADDDFAKARATLAEAAADLQLSGSKEGRLAALAFARAMNGETDPATTPSSAPQAPPPATALGTAASSQNAELIEEQNKVLREQVEEMRAMMMKQTLSVESYMSTFPQPADEAERRMTLRRLRLYEQDVPMTRVDDLLANVTVDGEDGFGPGWMALFVNIIGESTSRCIGLAIRTDEGVAVSPPRFMRLMDMQRTSRKSSFCQYVVATGKTQLFQRGDTSSLDGKSLGGVGMKTTPIVPTAAAVENGRIGGCCVGGTCGGGDEDGSNERIACAARGMIERDLLRSWSSSPALGSVDKGVNSDMTNFNAIAAMSVTNAQLEAMPRKQRIVARLKRAAGLALVERLPEGIRHMMMFMMKVASKEGGDATYLGAPIRCQGHAMGSLCAVYGTVAEPSELAKAQKRLERAADRLGTLLETM